MYKAIIVEDETRSRTVLTKLIDKYCPEVSVVAAADSVKSGVTEIETHKPNLVFLDVQLTDGTGFDILSQIDVNGIAVIFTTAFDQYALKAFRFSAIDYLLKPIDIEELKSAVGKVTRSFDQDLSTQKLEHLLSNLRRDPHADPIMLISTADSVEFIDIRDIVRCEADGAYCTVFLRDGQKHVASKVIKEFELLLDGYGFFRVHQSHLVNLRELSKYSRADNQLILRDGSRIQLARSRKENFFKELDKLRI